MKVETLSAEVTKVDSRRGSSPHGFDKQGEKAIDEEFQPVGYNIDVHMGPAVGRVFYIFIITSLPVTKVISRILREA
jgi:hypothetical protein